MYRFLKAEMIKANISVPELAKKISVSEKTLRNKINESTEFTWNEALVIRNIVNEKIDMETMFQTDATRR